MRLKNDDDEEYSGLSVRMPTVMLVASLAIFGVLAIVVLANNNKRPSSSASQTPTQATQVTSEEEPMEQADSLRADDLNFWGMYADTSVADIYEEENSNASRKDELEQREEEMKRAEEEAAEAAAKEAESRVDPATDGKHTLVTHIDGTNEWIAINSSIKLNTYEDTQFQSQNGIIGYYNNGRRTTRTGADISQYTTTVDWKQLATEVDYVMIRVGARGYDSGNIIADTKFIDNVTGAVQAGIPFGVYFSSQAINETEAKEEATYVMTQLAAAKSAVDRLGLSATGTTVTGSSSTGTTSSGTTANVTSETVKDKLQKLGLETDKTKYNTTTTVKDTNGNTTTTEVDDKGNTTVTVKDANGNQISKKTVNLDPYGNVTTVDTDQAGKETVVTVMVAEAAVVPAPGTTTTTNANGTTSTANADSTKTDTATKTTTTTNSDGSTTTTTVNADGTTTTTTTGTDGSSTTTTTNLDGSTIVKTTNADGTTTTTTTPATKATPVFKLTYPVAIEMHLITNDISRIEKIDKNTRTSVLTTFCSVIESGGYDAMVEANKEFLLCQVNTAALTKYEIWLANEGNLPDYPYVMSMWKYNSKGKLLNSLAGDYGVNVGFIDYSVR
ncbi:MAG: hypothetical protein J5509_08780 [Lachnospiraceae bacterium]|nr:hypothetical protein [Lachnospiraceae bacterium]